MMQIYFRAVPICVIMLIAEMPLISQQHDNIWLFGYGSSDPENHFGGSMLDFSIEPPLVSYFAIPLNFKASSSICDTKGELVAYTNGCMIMNRNHILAENGDSINEGFIHDIFCEYGYPIPQGVVLVPMSNEENRYRLLHLWEDRTGYITELRSTETIFNLDSLAEVVNKNTIVATSIYSRDITAVRHGNGRDWWVVLPRYKSSVHEKFISNPNRVMFVDTQEIGTAWNNKDWSGQMAYSPDGRKYVRVNPFNGLHIFDFDRCSGELSNPIVIDFPNDTISSCGAAFSQDSRFLYVSASLKVYQFDMQANNIRQSRKTVAVYDGFLADYGLSTPFYQQMLAPNGKIYITAPNSVRYLHVIHDPEEIGADCNLEQHGLLLPALHAFSTPNFPHYRLGPLDGSPCDTLGLDNHPVAGFRYTALPEDPLSIKFTDLSYHEPTLWEWDFGDGTHHTFGRKQQHTYASSGAYHVCLTVSNSNATDSTCKWIDVMTTEVGEIAGPSKAVTIYPNPASSYFVIDFKEDTHALCDVMLIDMYGRTLKSYQELSLPARIDIDEVPAGVYVCTAGQEGKVIAMCKLIKQ